MTPLVRPSYLRDATSVRWSDAMFISRTIMMLVFSLNLASCSGPSYAWIINGAGERLEIVFASSGNVDANQANGSPWFWPWRTNPVLRPGEGYRLTAPCYGCRPDWNIRVRIRTCELAFSIHAPPEDAYDRPEWQAMTAYRDDSLQVGRDLLLYRIPAYAGEQADISKIPQPDGYPLSAVRGGSCDDA
jgi:hypothetical protein